jgi:hypothetical protein
VTVAAPAAPQVTPGTTPTPELSAEPTPPIPSGDLIEASAHPSADPGDTTNATPSDRPVEGTGLDGAVGMRVVDRGATDGLLETIVGGVTGFFFGG